MNEVSTTNINLLKKSINLINQNKINEAEEILIGLSKFKDFQVDTFLYLGICKIKKKENEKAIEFLKRSLKLNPNHEYANLNLGLVYFSNKNLDISLIIGIIVDKISSKDLSSCNPGISSFPVLNIFK